MFIKKNALWLIIGLIYTFSEISFARIIDDEPEPQESKPTYTTDMGSLSFSNQKFNQDFYNSSTKDVDKKFISLPILEVNTYMGNLKSYFNIRLPKNYFSLSSLKFKYNSFQNINIGFGIGWSLDLPQIIHNNETYYINDKTESSSLVVAEQSLLPEMRMNKIYQSLKFKSKDWVVYRPKLEQDFSLYLKNKKTGQWLKIETSGKTSLFSKNGQLRVMLDSFGHKLFFDYDENQMLEEIKSHASSWSVKFHYNRPSENSLPLFLYNNFLDIPAGLKNIVIQQGKKKEKIFFSYKKNLLTSVKREHSIKTLFTGSYKIPQQKLIKTVYNNLKPDVNQVEIYKDSLEKNTFLTIDENSKDKIYYIDINGDFYTDKVTFHFNEHSEKVKKAIENCHECGSSKYQNAANSIPIKMTIQIANHRNGTTSYKIENSLTRILTGENKPLQYSVFIKETGHLTYSYVFSTHISLSPLFVDIDKNGRKDILWCPYKKSLDQVPYTSLSNNKKQNPMAVGVFKLFYPDKIKPYTSPFDHNSESARISYLAIDRKKLATKVSDEKSLHYVYDVSYWKDKVSSLHCHQYSLVLDANNDSYNDIITGTNLYLTGNNNQVRKISLSHEKLKSFFKAPSNGINLRQAQLNVIDKDGDNIFEISRAYLIGFRPDSRYYTTHFPGETRVYERGNGSALLTRYTTSFGGHGDVTYKFKDGAYIVDRIHYISKVTEGMPQGNFSKEYNYGKSKWHLSRNILLGYEDTVEITRSDEHPSGGKILKKTFTIDNQNGPLFYFSRARLNGRVKSQEWKNIETNKVDKKEVFENSFITLGETRIFPYIKKATKTTSGIGTKVIETTFSDFTSETPRKMIKKYSTDKGSFFQEESFFNFSQDYFTRHLSEKKEVSKDGKNLSHNVEYFTDIENNRTYKKKKGELERLADYDEHGRLKRVKDKKGTTLKQFNYLNNGPLLSTVQDQNGLTTLHYHPITNFVSSSQLNNGAPLFYDWFSDEIPKKIVHKNKELFILKKVDRNTFQITQKDKTFVNHFDGFGRTYKKIENLPGKDLILFEKEFNYMGASINESSPRFEGGINEMISEMDYDSLGRLISKAQLVSTFSTIKMDEIIYSGHKKIFMDFDTMKLLTLKDGMGRTTFSESGNEKVEFVNTPLGSVEEVKNLGIKYLRNFYGEVISSSSPHWKKEEVILNKTEKTATLPAGTQYINDEFDRLKSYKTPDSNDYSVTIFNEYKKNLLSLRQGVLKTQKINFPFIHNISYDTSALISAEEIFGVGKVYTRGEFDRIKTTEVTHNNNSYILGPRWENGRLKSISPLISKIKYNHLSLPFVIEHSSGLKLIIEWTVLGELKGFLYKLSNKNVLYQSYRRGINRKIISTDSNLFPRKMFEYENEELVSSPTASTLLRNDRGQAEKHNKIKFSWTEENLTAVKEDGTEITIFYDEMGSHLMSCPNSKDTKLEHCFVKISPTEYTFKNNYMRLITLGKIPMGVQINKDFYPAMLNHQMALVGLFTADGDKVLFQRHHDDWGVLEKVTGSDFGKKIEKIVPWTYGKLTKNPLVKNPNLLWSTSRVYAAEKKEWLSIDPLVKWSPDKLVGSPGNWDGTMYAKNDPVNFVDPSGLFINSAGKEMAGPASPNKSDREYSSIAQFDAYDKNGADAKGIEKNYADIALALGAYAGVKALGAVGYSTWARMYPSGGAGVGVDKFGKNIGRVDIHKFSLGGKRTGRQVFRPHLDIPGRVKHFPWHQIDKWKRGIK